MFTMRFWDLFGSDGVSCVKLPAAVAFPTDDRLLRRIEEQRRALPANNMKPLWRSRETASSPEATCALRGPDIQDPFAIRMPAGALDSFRGRVEPRLPPAQVSAVSPEAEPRAQNSDGCVVPLARAHARARDGLSASAA